MEILVRVFNLAVSEVRHVMGRSSRHVELPIPLWATEGLVPRQLGQRQTQW